MAAHGGSAADGAASDDSMWSASGGLLSMPGLSFADKVRASRAVDALLEEFEGSSDEEGDDGSVPYLGDDAALAMTARTAAAMAVTPRVFSADAASLASTRLESGSNSSSMPSTSWDCSSMPSTSGTSSSIASGGHSVAPQAMSAVSAAAAAAAPSEPPWRRSDVVSPNGSRRLPTLTEQGGPPSRPRLFSRLLPRLAVQPQLPQPTHGGDS